MAKKDDLPLTLTSPIKKREPITTILKTLAEEAGAHACALYVSSPSQMYWKERKEIYEKRFRRSKEINKTESSKIDFDKISVIKFIGVGEMGYLKNWEYSSVKSPSRYVILKKEEMSKSFKISHFEEIINCEGMTGYSARIKKAVYFPDVSNNEDAKKARNINEAGESENEKVYPCPDDSFVVPILLKEKSIDEDVVVLRFDIYPSKDLELDEEGIKKDIERENEGITKKGNVEFVDSEEKRKRYESKINDCLKEYKKAKFNPDFFKKLLTSDISCNLSECFKDRLEEREKEDSTKTKKKEVLACGEESYFYRFLCNSLEIAIKQSKNMSDSKTYKNVYRGEKLLASLINIEDPSPKQGNKEIFEDYCKSTEKEKNDIPLSDKYYSKPLS